MVYTQDSGLRTGYSRLIRRETKFLKEKADTAPLRRNVSGFTIDKIDSPDLDDGIWIEKIKNAFRLQISISDVSELIARETKLYEEAKERCTSLYFNTHIFHMFPHEIATDMASLNHHTTRKSLTLELLLDEEGGVQNIELFESLFFNKKRFGYRQTNESMTSSRDEFFEELNLLADLAKILYKRRGDSGFLPSLDSQRTINIGERNLFQKRSSNIASFIVQECMILANIEIAKYMIAHKINGIFRNHHFEKGAAISFGKATYSQNMEFHEGLNLPYYTHFTSPIRRFADFVNHQQLKQSIRSQSQMYNSDQVGELVFHINDKIEQVLSLQSNYLSEVGARRKVRTINRQEGRFPQINDIGIAIRQKIKHKKNLPHIYKEIILLEISRSKHIEPWFLEYFLPSGELEIKNALKEKILSQTSYFKYLKILKNLKLLDYLIEFSEEKKTYSICIYFEGEIYYFDTVIDDSNKENFDFERKLWKTFLIQETLKKALIKILSLL